MGVGLKANVFGVINSSIMAHKVYKYIDYSKFGEAIFYVFRNGCIIDKKHLVVKPKAEHLIKPFNSSKKVNYLR